MRWGERVIAGDGFDVGPNAKHSGLGNAPRKLVECGGIWQRQNKETGADYFTLTIRDHAFNANLGIAASQDDASLQAIIPWGPKEAA